MLEAPRDPHWIDLQHGEDIRFWMQEFGITEAALRRVVQRVGALPQAVQSELQVRTTSSQV